MKYNEMKYMKIKLLLLIFTFVACETSTNSDCNDTNCKDYSSQSAAQAAFNADPECRSDLDADNDGIACEEPGNEVSDCGNTSNCGCSNLNKSPCEANNCCKWTVGEGCGCR